MWGRVGFVILLTVCAVACGGQVRGILEAGTPLMGACHLVTADVRDSLFELSRWIPMAERTVPVVLMANSPLVSGFASVVFSAAWPFAWLAGWI